MVTTRSATTTRRGKRSGMSTRSTTRSTRSTPESHDLAAEEAARTLLSMRRHSRARLPRLPRLPRLGAYETFLLRDPYMRACMDLVRSGDLTVEKARAMMERRERYLLGH